MVCSVSHVFICSTTHLTVFKGTPTIRQNLGHHVGAIRTSPAARRAPCGNPRAGILFSRKVVATRLCTYLVWFASAMPTLHPVTVSTAHNHKPSVSPRAIGISVRQEHAHACNTAGDKGSSGSTNHPTNRPAARSCRPVFAPFVGSLLGRTPA